MAPSTTRSLATTVTVVMVVMVMMVADGVWAQVPANSNQEEAADFLSLYEQQYNSAYNSFFHLYWQYENNITHENEQAFIDAEVQLGFWKQNMSAMAAQFNTSAFPASVKRQFHVIRDIGTAALKDAHRLQQLNNLLGNMSTIYNRASVCINNSCLPLEPDVTRIFQTSRDEKLLRRLWVGWRDATGFKMRTAYDPFVNRTNEAARTLGYEDTGAYWRSRYETESFEQDVAALFEELRPFYQQLHAFVRRRLKQQYGEDVFPSSGHIPAHLLGSMHGLSWLGIEDLVMPFPDKPKLDITATQQMVKQNFTARKIYEVAEDFYTSLGLEPMPQSFWENSMLEKPTDGRNVVCHASAWNFENGTDFRIRQCTQITMHHFEVAHHEMGHIAYFMLYRQLPAAFRDGANPGFHEAVGDTISLSVQTPRHLHKIGLLPTLVEDRESDLNFLMTMALQKIAALPFGYLVDQWRWSVFRGDTTPQNYTKAWWNLRCNVQGVSPPVKRTEVDFDPGSVFHVSHHVSFIRYFVSYVIQFQFHKALCQAAGHQGPLHTCDIYNSTQAGDKLRAMLSKGSSETWTKPFRALTGHSKMSAQPLIEFFQPLMDHLKEANRQNGEEVGWTRDCSPRDVSAGHRSFVSSAVVTVVLTILVVVVTVCG